MKTYILKVSAIGYDTIKYCYKAATRWEAVQQQPYAIAKWLEHNNLDVGAAGLAFVEITVEK